MALKKGRWHINLVMSYRAYVLNICTLAGRVRLICINSLKERKKDMKNSGIYENLKLAARLKVSMFFFPFTGAHTLYIGEKT